MAETYLSFEEAVKVLHDELKYPTDKAYSFVKTFDTNNDGKLSSVEFAALKKKIEEAKSTIVPMFKLYDVNGDGYITIDEAKAILQDEPFNFPATKINSLLTQFDKDKNGKLDIEEFAGFYAEAKATHEKVDAYFAKIDADGNGVLSPSELVQVIVQQMGIDEPTALGMVAVFDKNKDGNLDKKEFMPLWSKMFGDK